MHNETHTVNAYLAILVITIIGASAVLIITHAANAVADDADYISTGYETIQNFKE